MRSRLWNSVSPMFPLLVIRYAWVVTDSVGIQSCSKTKLGLSKLRRAVKAETLILHKSLEPGIHAHPGCHTPLQILLQVPVPASSKTLCQPHVVIIIIISSSHHVSARKLSQPASHITSQRPIGKSHKRKLLTLHPTYLYMSPKPSRHIPH